MKTKLVLWGSNATDEKILIAVNLRPEENMTDIWTFPGTVATDEFARLLMNDWRNDKEVEFPAEAVHVEKELSMTEDLLPEGIKAEREDIVQRAQTEWQFVVLSTKLNDVYLSELSELKEKVNSLQNFSKDVWNELKGFWAKVQGQARERNLLRRHADILREDTNQLFSRMKELRAALDEAFRSTSQKNHDSFMDTLAGMEGRIAKEDRLPALFDELKSLQRKFRDAKLTREHRSKVWQRLDAAFKVVKEKRFGPNANSSSSALERLNRRYKGLLGAIEKMERSIERDKDELKFQQRKIDSSDGQLEAQIRQAKINMTNDRVASKTDKLSEMMETKVELEKRIADQKQKEERRQKKQEVEAAKVAAKEKIAQKIAAAATAREDDEDKLEKAAEALTGKETTESADAEEPEAPTTETTSEAIDVTVVADDSSVKNDDLEEVIEAGAAIVEIVNNTEQEK